MIIKDLTWRRPQHAHPWTGSQCTSHCSSPPPSAPAVEKFSLIGWSCVKYFPKVLGGDLKDCEQRVDDGVEVWGWGALGEVQLAAEKLRKMLIVNEMMLAMIAPPASPAGQRWRWRGRGGGGGTWWRIRRSSVLSQGFAVETNTWKWEVNKNSEKDLNFKTGCELEKAWKLQPSIRALTLQCPLPLT